MKLENQVLSINQVQELQELGFDVKKYASMCWFEQTPFAPIEQPKKYELEILTDSLMGNRGYLEVIPTLTIGDIMGILPNYINIHFILKIERDFCGNIEIGYFHAGDNSTRLFYEQKDKCINALFETLKWCIKEKHIAL